jgi:hypothetical protein
MITSIPPFGAARRRTPCSAGAVKGAATPRAAQVSGRASSWASRAIQAPSAMGEGARTWTSDGRVVAMIRWSHANR